MKRWVLVGATMAGVAAYLWKKQQTPPRQGDWSAATDDAHRPDATLDPVSDRG